MHEKNEWFTARKLVFPYFLQQLFHFKYSPMEEIIIIEEEHCDDEAIAVIHVVLPSGFHWDDGKPVIIKKSTRQCN